MERGAKNTRLENIYATKGGRARAQTHKGKKAKPHTAFLPLASFACCSASSIFSRSSAHQSSSLLFSQNRDAASISCSTGGTAESHLEEGVTSAARAPTARTSKQEPGANNPFII